MTGCSRSPLDWRVSRKNSPVLALCLRLKPDDFLIKTILFVDKEREAKLSKLGDALPVLEHHVDFAAFAAQVDSAAPFPNHERGGRRPYPTELMVRVLLIQQLSNLSD
jgi:IS5 family transposase